MGASGDEMTCSVAFAFPASMRTGCMAGTAQRSRRLEDERTTAARRDDMAVVVEGSSVADGCSVVQGARERVSRCSG